MTRVMRFGLALLAALPLDSNADVSGTFIEEQNPSVALVLIEAPDGMVTGNLEGVSSMPLTARRSGDTLKGRVGNADFGLLIPPGHVSQIMKRRRWKALGSRPSSPQPCLVREEVSARFESLLWQTSRDSQGVRGQARRVQCYQRRASCCAGQ